MATQTEVDKLAADMRLELANRTVPGWKKQWINPFTRAYSAAFESYTKTLNAQLDSDKKAMELMLTVLSLGAGGIAGAVFGKTASKEVAADLALEVVCRRNWSKALNVMASVEGSEAAKFVLGGLWDAGQKEISAHLKKRLTTEINKHYTSLKKFKSLSAVHNPLTQYTFLDDFVSDNQLALDLIIEEIRDSKPAPDEKTKKLHRLKSSSSFFKPPAPPKEKDLADTIELILFLHLILNTDSLVVTAYSSNSVTASATQKSKTPVALSPSDKQYPTSKNLTRTIHKDIVFGYFTRGTSGTRQDVRYDVVGGKIRDRVDALTKAVLGKDKDFFHSSYSTFDPNGKHYLLKAETTLQKIGSNPIWPK